MRVASAIAALVLTTAAVHAPANAEVTASTDNGFAVRHTVTVSAEPDAAFAMLRTPGKWWDKAHTWTGNSDNLYMDAQAGGCFCELIQNDATSEGGVPQRTLRGSVQHMQIVYVDPGKLLRMSGALGPLQSEAMVGTMTVTLAPIKGGTKLTFEYVAGGFMRMATADVAPAVDGVIVAQASRFAMALGPLVGGGADADDGGEAPKPEATEDEGDAGIDAAGEGTEAQTSGSVGALVADLQPDDDTAATTPEDAPPKPAVKPAPKPAAKPAPKPAGTRPPARPLRDDSNDETGR
jgi:hypothetical protein